MALTEFGLITRYFDTSRFAVAPGCGVVLGIGDDAAILRLPSGQDLVVSIDTLVAGVHFPLTMAPEHIGHRALAVGKGVGELVRVLHEAPRDPLLAAVKPEGEFPGQPGGGMAF